LLALLVVPDSTGACPAADQIVRDRAAELWIDVQALRVTNLRTLSELAAYGRLDASSTIGKLRWSELNQRLAAMGLEIRGVEGLQSGQDDADGGRWLYRRLRSRGNSIEAGTSEVLRNIIAERVVGLARGR
jgi:alkylation response protein AidB-like acyl-CoA dehydrogenase